VVFLKLWIGLTVRNRLPRSVWVLRLAVRLEGYLLLGGAFPFGHYWILALIDQSRITLQR
jgi:hypothetical protein